MFDSTTLEVKREFDVGGWEVVAMKFTGRQLTHNDQVRTCGWHEAISGSWGSMVFGVNKSTSNTCDVGRQQKHHTPINTASCRCSRKNQAGGEQQSDS